MPRIVDERTCPACGVLQLSTTHEDNPRCTDCGTSLKPPEVITHDAGLQWHGAKELEAGAAYIRELVAKRKRSG